MSPQPGQVRGRGHLLLEVQRLPFPSADELFELLGAQLNAPPIR